MHRSAIVIKCRLSVMQVHCDKMAAARIMQFSLNVARCFNSLPAKFDDKLRRGPLDLGAQSRVGWFSTSRRCISETVQDRD